jgi:uncharacterized membrane protein YgdD (TMEM256/DUF423 family)
MDEQKPQEMLPALNIRYVGIGQLTVFFVSEDELRQIESGSPAATCLNLGIAFFCAGIGSLVSLLLSDPSKSLHKFVVVVVITVLSFIAGFVLLVVWSQLRKQASEVIIRIRRRAIPSAGATVMEAPTVESEGNA